RVPARRPPRAARFPSTTLFRSGVPESVTGTPLPLPPGDAAEALATLEFAAVLDRVASHAAGPAGAARVRGRVPTAGLAWARHEPALAGGGMALRPRGAGAAAEGVPEPSRAPGRPRARGRPRDGRAPGLLGPAVAA